ncbi:MAG: hypothetical protein ACI9EZ_001661 [Halobacteriales archaeon]|jgi:hypothetical protein
MTARLSRRLFVEMLREEFRLHARLFGGRRFAAFPFFVALVGAGTVWLLGVAGTPLETTIAGLHALAFAFGLHTGSIGLVGRDAMRDLLGDVTLLVFSARTVPVSRRRLLGVFLVKDVVYYAALFLAPLSVAFAVEGLGLQVVLLWATITGTFLLGITVTLAAIALSTRGVSGWVVLIALAGAIGLGWTTSLDPVGFTPYGVFESPGFGSVVRATVPIVALSLLGIATYDATTTSPSRTAESAFADWRERLSFDQDGLVTKSLLDVARSSGGFSKVPFSAGILFLVSVGMVELVGSLSGVDPSMAISMGAILGLTAFTTYNWLTQFDALSVYLLYPISLAAVFGAKFRAFLVLGLPTAIGYYAIAVVWWGGGLGEILVGAILLVGLQLYLFGLTVYLAGFRPNEFLFDTVLFALFTAAVAVGLVPVLIVGLVLGGAIGPAAMAGLVTLAVILGGAGVGLYRLSIPRWERRYRTE